MERRRSENRKVRADGNSLTSTGLRRVKNDWRRRWNRNILPGGQEPLRQPPQYLLHGYVLDAAIYLAYSKPTGMLTLASLPLGTVILTTPKNQLCTVVLQSQANAFEELTVLFRKTGPGAPV
jgi:hypothetical protein